MHIFTPEFMLFVWTVFSLTTIVLFITALANIYIGQFMRPGLRLAWTMVVLMIPVLGALLYFRVGSRQKLQHG